MSRQPLRTAVETDALDDVELIAGYHDGRAVEPEPGGNHSLSYWRGWRNGAADAGHIESDDAMRALAKDYLARERLRRALRTAN